MRIQLDKDIYMAEWARGFVEKCGAAGLDPEELVKQAQQNQLMSSSFDALSNNYGGAGMAGAVAGYMTPFLGTGMAAYDTLASGVNMFTPGITMGQRLGHGLGMLGNAAMTGLTLIPGVGGGAAGAIKGGIRAGLGAGMRGAAKAVPSASRAITDTLDAGRGAVDAYAGAGKALARTGTGRYLQGELPWQQRLKNWSTTRPGRNRWNPLNLGRKAVSWTARSPMSHMMAAGMIGGGMVGEPDSGSREFLGKGLARGLADYNYYGDTRWNNVS